MLDLVSAPQSQREWEIPPSGEKGRKEREEKKERKEGWVCPLPSHEPKWQAAKVQLGRRPLYSWMSPIISSVWCSYVINHVVVSYK